MRLLGLAFCCAFSLLLGCKSKKRLSYDDSTRHPVAQSAANKGPKKTAPEAKWDDYKLTLVGVPGDASFFAGSVIHDSDDPWILSAHFTLPAGTKITLGSESGTVESSSWHCKVPIKDAIAKAPAEDSVGKKIDLGLTLQLEIPGYELVTQKLPLQSVKPAIGKGFARIVDRPVTFSSEPEKSPIDGLLALDRNRTPRLFGNPKTTADIDLIAVEDQDDKPSREKTCTGYRKSKAVTLQMFDSDVKLYDRRSGKVLAERKFSASDHCPSFAFVTDGKTSNRVSDTDIDKWARAELQKRRGQ